MNDGVLEELASEITELRAQLEVEDLDAEAATRILERITALAQDALAAEREHALYDDEEGDGDGDGGGLRHGRNGTRRRVRLGSGGT